MKTLNAVVSLVSMSLAGSLFAAGATFHIKNGVSNWDAPESYTENAVPGADDIVEVARATTVYLDASTDAASLTRINALRNIYFNNNDSRFEITVAGTDEKSINVSMSAYGNPNKNLPGTFDYTGGPIVKKGSGTLILASAGFNKATSANIYDYYTTIVVDEGTLRLQPGYGEAGVHVAAVYGRVTVNEGATLYLPYCAYAGKNGGTGCMRSLAGGGTVTTAQPMSLKFNGTRKNGDYADFSGQLQGSYYGVSVEGDAQVLSGTASTATYAGTAKDFWSFTGGGRLAAADFGHKIGETSSLGLYPSGQLWWSQYTGFAFEFVNAADIAVEHGFVINSAATGVQPTIFDAGARGGVTFNGQWQRMYSSGGGNCVVLTGSNTVANVLNNLISDNTESEHATGRGHTLYMRKEGSGTWCVNAPAGVNREAFASGWSVDEGTLQFDSMAEKGQPCAFGVATNLTDGATGSADMDAAHRVDYAFRLGAKTLAGESKTSGRLEYVGTGLNTNWSRKVALAGEGGFTANGTTHHQIYGGGVEGISAGPMKLHLDGDSTQFNLVTDISDGSAGGKVSVCKAGEGTWTLGGDLTFTGDIEVTGGTLVYRKPTQYTWFRWSIQELYYGVSKNDNVHFYELGLYDANGTWRNGYLAYNASNLRNKDYLALEPGEVAFDQPYKRLAVSIDYTNGGVTSNITLSLERAFDNMYNGWGTWGVRYTCYHPDTGTVCTPVHADPKTWFSIVMRLTNGTDIAGYDFANVMGRWSAAGLPSTIKDCSMEGSVDGIHWDTLSELTSVTNHYDGGMWACQGGYVGGETATGYTGARLPGSFPGADNNYRDPAKMFPIAGVPASLPTVNDPAGVVSVSGGATFKLEGNPGTAAISKLKVDAAQAAGTIDGFAFASSGTLDIVNAAKMGAIDLPVNFVNVVGAANLANWNFTFNGKTSPARKLVYENGKLKLLSSGLMILLD